MIILMNNAQVVATKALGIQSGYIAHRDKIHASLQLNALLPSGTARFCLDATRCPPSRTAPLAALPVYHRSYGLILGGGSSLSLSGAVINILILQIGKAQFWENGL